MKWLIALVLVLGIAHVQGQFKSQKKESGQKETSGSGSQAVVVSLTTENFDSVILDRSKDVFVEFYASWCGHCKALIPHWEKLAQEYKDNKNVIIAKVDAEMNRPLASRYGIKGYPTMFLFSRGNKVGEMFRGMRDVLSFKEWLSSRIGITPSADQVDRDDKGIEQQREKENAFQKELDKQKTEKQNQLKQLKTTVDNKEEIAHDIRKRITEKIKEVAASSAQSKSPNSKDEKVAEKTVEKRTKSPVVHEEVEVSDEGTFLGFGNTQLFFRSWSVENPKGVIVLVHDLGDHSGTYRHFVNHLVPAQYSIHAFDLRGHGRSKGEKGHVGDWNEYREDLHTFIQNVKKEENTKEIFLAGHGLGALVALDYAMRFQKQSNIKGVMALSPLLQAPNIPALAEMTEGILGSVVSTMLPSFSVNNEFNFNAMSRDESLVMDLKNDPFVHSSISFGLHKQISAVANWVQEHATDIKFPVLINHGSADEVVPVAVTTEFVKKIPQKTDVSLDIYEGSFHRVFDDIGREDIFKDLIEWLNSH